MPVKQANVRACGRFLAVFFVITLIRFEFSAGTQKKFPDVSRHSWRKKTK